MRLLIYKEYRMTFVEFKALVKDLFPGATGLTNCSMMARHPRFAASIKVAAQPVLMYLEQTPSSLWEVCFESAHGKDKVVDGVESPEEALRHAARAVD